MLSTTLKRSAATLGVIAGLLAVAGPASALELENTMVSSYKAPQAPVANSYSWGISQTGTMAVAPDAPHARP
jgi:hypothetical protein